MKKIDLGKSLNTIANIGALIGIVIVAIEIRQNNELLELEAYRTFNDRVLGQLDVQLEPEFLKIALADPSTLTPEESLARFHLATRMFLVWEEQYELILADRFTPDEVLAAWRNIWRNPQFNFGMPDMWESYKPRARPEFVEFVQTNVVEVVSAE